MDDSRGEIVAWVASHILPHERGARGWLRRTGAAPAEIEAILREVYSRLADLDRPAAGSGRAYFLNMVRTVALERLRRSRVVHIDSAAEIDALSPAAGRDAQTGLAAGRLELRRTIALVEALPERCREIFKLRRVQGLSQREVARLFRVSEAVVEMQTARALKLILQAMARGEDSRWTPKAAQIDDAKKGGARS